MSDKKSEEIKDLPKKTPLTSSELEGVVGGLPKEGGGASDPGVLDCVLAALRAGGRLVVNAVTLQTEALLLARHSVMGGELIRIAIARADPVGSITSSMTIWRPAVPVTQWRWVKP